MIYLPKEKETLQSLLSTGWFQDRDLHKQKVLDSQSS